MYQNKSRAVNGLYRKEHFMKKQPDGSNGLGEVVEQIHAYTDMHELKETGISLKQIHKFVYRNETRIIVILYSIIKLIIPTGHVALSIHTFQN